MKKIVFLLLSLFLATSVQQVCLADHHEDHETHEAVHADGEHSEEAHIEADHSEGHGAAAHIAHILESPPGWTVIPFVLLLLMIATGPLFFAHFWHKYYPLVALGLAAMVIGYYIIALHDTGSPIHALAEYIQFIALLGSLFMASGGILINVDKAGKPLTNVMLLIIGAVMANMIGTTGASMLLIRPFIRLNKNRIKVYHIIFFIFMVSNVGGSLTPIGDPPLFLGFLKGVPFAWTLTHNVVPWAVAIGILAAIFFFFDNKNKSGEKEEGVEYTGKVTITGSKNFLWLAVIIGAVFIDPNVFPKYIPGITAEIHGHTIVFSYLRELIMISVACLSYYFADKKALAGNEFEFEPVKEVAFIFIGIFFTMMPALQLVADYAKSDDGSKMITTNTLYWGTGSFSGVLDNAPTYVNFLTAAIAKDGGNVHDKNDVLAFAGENEQFEKAMAKKEKETGHVFTPTEKQKKKHDSIVNLIAISVASVFFGAMTYIGNAPNFMVKSIAEQVGIKMPSFVSYVVKYSIPILLPVLLVIWFLFFYLDLVYLIVPH